MYLDSDADEFCANTFISEKLYISQVGVAGFKYIRFCNCYDDD